MLGKGNAGKEKENHGTIASEKIRKSWALMMKTAQIKIEGRI